jgi:hypothetical protein
MSSRGHTIEGSWVQEFKKIVGPCKTTTTTTTTKEPGPSTALLLLKNDFGRVLFDFLKHQVFVCEFIYILYGALSNVDFPYIYIYFFLIVTFIHIS